MNWLQVLFSVFGGVANQFGWEIPNVNGSTPFGSPNNGEHSDVAIPSAPTQPTSPGTGLIAGMSPVVLILLVLLISKK